MKNKILVTGGSGFIGSELVRELLLDNNNFIVVIDTMWFGNNLPKHKRIKIINKDIRNIRGISLKGINTIIHLACVANDPSGELNSKMTWEINVLATKLLVESAVKYKVKNFIYASSGSVYGIKKDRLVHEKLDLEPISDYNKTKMIAEKVLLSYKNKIRLVIVRPATVCGISMRTRFDVVVNLLTIQALENKKMIVLGGKQIRPNVHMNDMVRFYLYALKNKRIKGIFNLGNENISVKKIAMKISKKINNSKIIIKKSNDPRSYRLDSTKIKNKGFKFLYNVDNAIDDIIKKYFENSLKNKPINNNVKYMLLKRLHVE